MAETIGKLVTEMELKDKQFQDSLKKLTALAKVTKESIGELSDITIDPEGNIKVRTKNLEEHNKKVSEGQTVYKDFRKEQELQNKVFAQGTNAILGITTALTFLTERNDSADESVKKIQRTLLTTVTAINTVQFSFFALGQAGQQVGGTLGGLLTRLSSLAGPIGIAVGLGAGLISFFQNTNEAAKKAADEGLKLFNEQLGTLGEAKFEVTTKQIDDRIKSLRQQRDALVKQSDTALDPELRAQRKGLEITDKAAYDLLTKRIKLLDEYREKIKDTQEANKEAKILDEERRLILEANLPILEKIKLKINELEKLRQKSYNAVDIQNYTNQIAELNKQQEDLLKTDAKRKEEQAARNAERIKQEQEFQQAIESEFKEQLEIYKLNYESGQRTKETTREYIAQLRDLQSITENKKLSQQIEIEINRLLKEQSDSARQAQELVISEIQARLQLKQISAETAIAQLQSLEKETTDILEIAKIREAIGNIQKQSAEQQAKALEEQYDQVSRIGNLFAKAFSKSGDDFIAKLNQALQIAVNIARVMQTVKAGENIGGLGILEIVGNVLSLFGGGFASGGYTGSGNPRGIAGFVHNDEVVFESGITRNNRSDLMALRSQLQQGGTVRNAIQNLAPRYLQNPTFSGSDIEPLLNEIRMLRAETSSLRATVASAPPPIVQVVNPITLLDGFKMIFPEYEKFQSQKNID